MKGIAAEKGDFLKIMSCPMNSWNKRREMILPMYKMYEPEKDLYMPILLNVNEFLNKWEQA